MKKFLNFILVAILSSLSFSLVSCGSNDDDEPGGLGYKFQTLTINGKDFFNCTSGLVYLASVYKIEDGYVWENGQYVKIEKAQFYIHLYDEKSVEANGIAEIDMTIPSSSFSNDKTITNDIIDFRVTVLSQENWSYDEDDRNHEVMGGSVKLTDVKKGKATVNFNDFKIKLDGQTITLNGKATCEE